MITKFIKRCNQKTKKYKIVFLIKLTQMFDIEFCLQLLNSIYKLKIQFVIKNLEN